MSQSAANPLANLNVSLLRCGARPASVDFLPRHLLQLLGNRRAGTSPRRFRGANALCYLGLLGREAVLRSSLVKRWLGLCLKLGCFARRAVNCPCEPHRGGLGRLSGLKAAEKAFLAGAAKPERGVACATCRSDHIPLAEMPDGLGADREKIKIVLSLLIFRAGRVFRVQSNLLDVVILGDRRLGVALCSARRGSRGIRFLQVVV